MQLGDKEIRAFLIPSLKKKLNPDSNIIVEEFDLAHGEARADIAIVNGKLTGIEIKSDRDTLIRLERQIGLYNQYFDIVEIYAAEKHLKKIKKMTPRWWGIKRIFFENGKVKAAIVRKAKRNQNQNIDALVSLLWKEEAINLLKKYDCAAGFESKTRAVIWQQILEKIDRASIKKFVLCALKSRQNWRVAPLQMLSDG